MSDPDFFSSTRICILGLGLMGASLAMALRGKCASLLGIDPDNETRSLAVEWGLVDQVSEHPSELLPQADLVILAAPVSAIIQLINDLPRLHPGRAIVIDFGSTKVEIVRVLQALPARFDPLGGHPMCGKEYASIRFAEAGLFQAAPFALTPLPRTSAHTRLLGEQLALTIGARPIWLDAQTHDHWVAASSHLPYLLSNALAAVTPLEVAPMLGTGFQSTARLSVSDRKMMLDILTTNKENIISSLEAYIQQLQKLGSLLKTDDLPALRALLEQGAARYEELISDQGGEGT